MRLSNLVDLNILLKMPRNKEARRLFGLKHKYPAKKQLELWIEDANLKDGKSLQRGFEIASNLLYVVSFLLGLVVAFGLLKFGANGYINVVYIMIFTIFVPIILGIASLIYMLKSPKETMLPSAIMLKIISYFTQKNTTEISSKVLTYYNLKSAAIASFYFSLALSIALILAGIGKDLPFGWSTTLDISSIAFYNFVDFLQVPFKLFAKEFVNLDIVEASRYFNGIKSQKAVDNISLIHSSWWYFVVATSLLYGVSFRAIIAIFALIKYKRVLNSEIFALDGTLELIDDFNRASIKSHKEPKEEAKSVEQGSIAIVDKKIDYDALLGWGVDRDGLLLLEDRIKSGAKRLESVGGLNSISRDLEIANTLKEHSVGLFVNSYDVPTLDFVDFATALAKKAKMLYVVLLNPKRKDLDIWSQKLSSIGLKNIAIKVYNDS